MMLWLVGAKCLFMMLYVVLGPGGYWMNMIEWGFVMRMRMNELWIWVI
jgi:hypothetical protein